MASTFVKNALKECQMLNAEISRNANIKTIGRLWGTNRNLAISFERRLMEELEQIKIAPGLDQDNKFPVEEADLRDLRTFQMLFTTALKNLEEVRPKSIR